MVTLADAHAPGLVVKPDGAIRQMHAEGGSPCSRYFDWDIDGAWQRNGTQFGGSHRAGGTPPAAAKPKRFHGTAVLDATRVGRDASQIAEEVISHLAGLVGSKVTVTIEIEAEIPDGAPDHLVRTVTENSRTLKFTSHGFEKE